MSSKSTENKVLNDYLEETLEKMYSTEKPGEGMLPCNIHNYGHDVVHKPFGYINDVYQEDSRIFKLPQIKKHKTYEVKVGNKKIGGNNPVLIQSMALNIACDVKEATEEAIKLIEAGSELVRFAINSYEAIKGIPQIRENIFKAGYDGDVLVGCGQFEVARIIKNYPKEVDALVKLRINPGTVGTRDTKDENFDTAIEYAIKSNKPVRIGVNWGSVDKHLKDKLMEMNGKMENPRSSSEVENQALILSVLLSAKRAEMLGMRPDQIVVSCKVSRVQDLISVHRALAKISKYAIHLGLTEAGMGQLAIVSTTAALSILLQEGIGDTIRASLTTRMEECRTGEVHLCNAIVQALGLKSFTPRVNSCPGCGRAYPTPFRTLAGRVSDYISARTPEWKQNHEGVESMNVAVMGCTVNGPGESKHADIGISLPGVGETGSGKKPIAAVFANGKIFKTIKGDDVSEIGDVFEQMLEDYVKEHYKKKTAFVRKEEPVAA